MRNYGKGYSCAFCNKSGVKLWRPPMDISPLTCASCSEQFQVVPTDEQLVVDSSAEPNLVPAILDEDDNFEEVNFASVSDWEAWGNLPSR